MADLRSKSALTMKEWDARLSGFPYKQFADGKGTSIDCKKEAVSSVLALFIDVDDILLR